MFKKFVSKCTAIISASAITLCTLTSFTVSAHNGDYFNGIYKGSTAPYNIKATPHKDCAADAQSDFLSDCIKNLQAGCRLSRIFCVI